MRNSKRTKNSNLQKFKTMELDLISKLSQNGLINIAEQIFALLNANDLKQADQVCAEWQLIVKNAAHWKKLMEHKAGTNTIFHAVLLRRNWLQHLFQPRPMQPQIISYRELYFRALCDVKVTKKNWKTGHSQFTCMSCKLWTTAVCMELGDTKMVSSMVNGDIHIWLLETSVLVKTLRGHDSSVECLKFDNQLLISCSADGLIAVWNIDSGELLNELRHDNDKVVCLRLSYDTIVTAFSDHTIGIWHINTPADIVFHFQLIGHTNIITDLDFDAKYIVTASTDGIVKVWHTENGLYVRDLRIPNSHCSVYSLEYHDDLVVSGCIDGRIRIWNVQTGCKLRTILAHVHVVSRVCFNKTHIVSGAFYGEIVVWNLAAAIDRNNTDSMCLGTLDSPKESQIGLIVALKINQFQVMSGSQDGAIRSWNFFHNAN